MGLMDDFGTDFAEKFSKHLARFFSQCLNKPRMWAKKIFYHFCGFLYPQNGVVKPFCFFWKYSFFALKKSLQILSFQNFVAFRYVMILVSAGEKSADAMGGKHPRNYICGAPVRKEKNQWQTSKSRQQKQARRLSPKPRGCIIAPSTALPSLRKMGTAKSPQIAKGSKNGLWTA